MRIYTFLDKITCIISYKFNIFIFSNKSSRSIREKKINATEEKELDDKDNAIKKEFSIKREGIRTIPNSITRKQEKMIRYF